MEIHPGRPYEAYGNASGRMARRFDVPFAPEIPLQERKNPYEATWDVRLGCYVRAPREAPQFDTRKPRRLPPLPRTRGRKLFKVYDQDTGVVLGVLAADTASQAASVAASWAVACGEPARSVYVK